MKVKSGEWKGRQLDELGFVGRGKSRHRPRAASFLYGGPYPFFQTGDVKAANLYLTDFTQTYSAAGLAQSKLWKPGTVCITIAANIAETAILGVEGCFPDSIVGFVADPEKADARFVKYSIDAMKLQMQGVSHGTTQDNLSVDKLLRFKFLTPTPRDQRRIADVLSAYDDLIENNLRRIKILEEMARALYREWFVEFRFRGHDRVPRITSPIGAIPESWPVTPLSELVSTQYGYTESASEEPVGPKYLRGMDINKTSFIDWSRVPYCPIAVEEQRTYELKRGDVVVIRMADPGKVGIVEEDVDAVFASYLIRLTPRSERILPYFLFFTLDSTDYQDYVSGASTGTTRKSASAGVMTEFRLPLPPKELVLGFEEQVRPLRDLLTMLLRASANLRRTRDLLLPRLMSGQITLDEAVA